MAIKIFVALEGAEDIVKSLDTITSHSKEFADSINNIGGATGAGGTAKGLQDVTVFLGGASNAMQQHARSVNDVTEAYHILRPILGEFGGSVSEIRGLAILAREGIEGIAIALGATFAVAAAKAADALATLQRSFQFLFGTTGAGAFATLKQNLDGIGASIADLAPSLTAALNALQRLSSFKGVGIGGEVTFGSPQQIKLVTDAIAALQKQLENLGVDAPGAAKAVDQFVKSISSIDPKTLKPVGLTLDAFLQLQRDAPEIAKTVADAFQQNLGGNLFDRLRKGPVDFLTTIREIAAIKIKVDAEPIPDSVTKSLDELRKAFRDLLADAGQGGLGVAGFISGLGGALTALTPIVQEVIRNITSLGTTVATFFGDIGKLGTALGAAFTSGDFSGAFAALKNVVTDLVSNLLSGLEGALGGLPSRILAALGGINFVGVFQGLIDAAGRTFVVVEDLILKGFESLIPSLKSIPWTDAFSIVLTAAEAVIESLTAAWTKFFNFLDEQNRKSQQPGGAGTPEGPLIGPLTAPETFQPAVDASQTAHDRISKAWQDLIPLTGLAEGETQAASSFGAFVDGLLDKFKALKDLVSQAVISPAGAASLVPGVGAAALVPQAVTPTTPVTPTPVATPPAETTADLAAQKAQVDAIAEGVAGVEQSWTSVDDSITEATDLVTVMGEGISGASDVISGLVSAFGILAGAIAQATQNAQQLLQSLIDLSAQQVPNVNTGGGGGGFAGGGLIQGVGTPTSDSNLIWASVNEFMQPARAVQYYGVSFMEAIRNLQLPRDLWRGMRMPTIPIGPGFAGGGLIGPRNTLRPIVLNIAGKGSFNGTIDAPDSVVNQLGRESVFEQLAAGGRSPGWRRS